MELINKKENIFGDDIAFVEQYDFSRANSSDEARTLAITTIATVCTQKFDSIGSEKLCTKLLTEAHGIPSSAYGFVPVLLNAKQMRKIAALVNKEVYIKHDFELNITKFGQMVEDGRFLLTNLRALVNDIGLDESKNYYNDLEVDIAIIKKHFKVFKHKMDIRSARQFMRHTTAVWQELSRRYVSGKKVPFEFYISDNMKKIKSKQYADTVSGLGEYFILNTEEVLDIAVSHYYEALEDGVKPQDARDILPLCTYTEIWSGWQPFALDNMLKERTAIGTQWELRQTAIAMQELISDKIGFESYV